MSVVDDVGEKMLLSYDTVEVAFDNDGFSLDEDDENFGLDEDRVVKVNNTPWSQAFDTDTFVTFPATVARPIKQPYVHDGERYTFKKPSEELSRAAWSLDNKPFTLGHPSTGRVKSVDDVHGFWRDPEYDSDASRLHARLYIPVTDDEALRFVRDNDNVSVGFAHRLTASEEEGVDAYQTDLYFDHVAGVEKGRCSDEDGCGIDKPNQVVDSMSIDELDEVGGDGDYSVTPDDWDDDFDTDAYYDGEGNYFAVSPSEGNGEPKYPINSCSDARDAWNLRSHGNIGISVETLERRIKQRAGRMGCSDMPWQSDNSIDEDESMTEDCDCMTDSDTDDDGGDTKVNFDASSFSIDYLKEKNDDVAELFDTVDSLEDKIDELEDEVDEKEETLDDVREELDGYRQDEKDEIVDEITDITDTWDEDELSEMELDALEERLVLAREAHETTDTANSDRSDRSGFSTDDAKSSVVDPKGVHGIGGE